MTVHELAGKPAPRSLLVNIPRLMSAYYTRKPDVSDPTQRVAFGTSGHRGSSLKNSFNEEHILAVSQAVYDYRKSKKIDGSLFVGMDTHALSEAVFASALEVFAANNVTMKFQKGLRYTPTPVISHAILTHNRARKKRVGRWGRHHTLLQRFPAARDTAQDGGCYSRVTKGWN
jgi:phosphoglucomutase